jgi:small subunit ribosomal protein S20
MPSYRFDVRALVRDVREVSVGKVRRLTHHMLHHWSRFGRPVGLALGDSRPRWYPEQSLPVAGRLADFPNPVEICEGNTRVANIKSQQKRILTNERRRLRNKSVKSSLHTAVRGFRDAVEAGDKDKAAELLASTSRKLDQAASKGVIHKNQAANRKSGLAAALNSL